MTKFSAWKRACIVFLLCDATAIAGQAQTFTNLLNFDGTNGSEPEYGPLTQGIDGNFYGTTQNGGSSHDEGTVFKITAEGMLTTLHSFCIQANCSDGDLPGTGLVLATDGNFYGTTQNGGANSSGGTVFKIISAGTLTTLYSFCAQTDCGDGAEPKAGLIQAADGSFYGTTAKGGVSSSCEGGFVQRASVAKTNILI
jgi:uncharacterized repeat protein (TIGR03803 family)